MPCSFITVSRHCLTHPFPPGLPETQSAASNTSSTASEGQTPHPHACITGISGRSSPKYITSSACRPYRHRCCILQYRSKPHQALPVSAVLFVDFFTFPPGIPIGTVEDMKDSHDGLSYVLKVKLFTDFARLQDVCIISRKGKEEQLQLESKLKEKE